MFQQPRESTGEKVPMPELVGSLCLVYVREVKKDVQTDYGPKEAIACDWHVLDGPHGGETFDNALIFQLALIGALKGGIGGEPILGRIGLGIKKGANNPPYLLLPFTDQDAALATAWITRQTQAGLQQPAQQQAAPPPPPVPTPQPVSAPPSPGYPPATTAGRPSPAAPSPATPTQAGSPPQVAQLVMTTAGQLIDLNSTPAEVVQLLRETGQLPAA